MKKTIAVLLSVIFSIGSAFAQTAQWKTSRHSLYAGAGVNMFMGDLGGGDGKAGHVLNFKDMDFNALRPSLTLGYKYKIAQRWSLRANVLYSAASADDSRAENDGRFDRNLNFKSNLWDLGGCVDFYFIKEKEVPAYGNLNFWKRWSAYVFAGASAVFYNPKGELNGDWVKLRELHTEGQETGVTYKTLNRYGDVEEVETDDEYGKVTFSYPFGIGIKYLINRKWAIGLEVAQRYTTTDYIDDVHSRYYFNYDNIRDYNYSNFIEHPSIKAPSTNTMLVSDKHLDASGNIASEKYPTGWQGRASNDYKDAYWTVMFTVNYKFLKNTGNQFFHRPKYY